MERLTSSGPTNDHKAMIGRAMEARGWIINSYSQVEYLLADAVARCRGFSEYESLTKTFPYQPSRRSPRFQALLQVAGPLDLDRDDLEKIVEKFDETSDRRHLLVHGFMTAEFISPIREVILRFRKFEPTPQVDDAVVEGVFSLYELESLKEESTEDAQFALEVFQRVHRRLGWQALRMSPP